MSNTVEDIALLSSLSVFSTARLTSPDSELQEKAVSHRAAGHSSGDSLDPEPTTDSVLFLRVRAAADYYSNDKALMENVPPVAVDLILDPFLWNVFPRSLVPTAGWILVVAAVAFVIARWVAAEIGRVMNDARKLQTLEEKQGKKEK